VFRWLTRRFRRDAASRPQGYAICTAPRSGSNLLCQWLTGTDLLGRPLEYFNGGSRRILNDPGYPDDCAAQIDWIQARTRTPNGVYGVKLFSDNRQLVAPTGAQPALPVDVYVYLERADRLAQAISWVRAMQTQQYRSTQPARGSLRYDGAAIHERLLALEAEHRNWTEFFRQHAIDPVRIAYEDALRDPQAAVDRIAARFALDQRPRVDPAAVDLQVQRDATSAEWRECYLREFGAAA
jgi:trehalose 2-sulfotransferase